MATSKYYVGDVGTRIEVDTLIDITDATLLQLIVKKPGGTIVTWPGTISGGTAIAYVVGAGDFSAKGMYQVQAYVENVAGHWLGDVAEFNVSAAFE